MNDKIETLYIIDPENQQKVFDANIPFFVIKFREIWNVVALVDDDAQDSITRETFFSIVATKNTLDFEIALREPSFGGVPALVSHASIIKTSTAMGEAVRMTRLCNDLKRNKSHGN